MRLALWACRPVGIATPQGVVCYKKLETGARLVLVIPLQVGAQDDQFFLAEHRYRERDAHIPARNGQIGPAGLNFSRAVDCAPEIMAACPDRIAAVIQGLESRIRER